MLELDAGIFRSEAPIHAGGRLVPCLLPGSDLPLECLTVGQPSVQALRRQNSQFELDHVKVAAGLSSATGKAYAHSSLRFDEFEFVDGQLAIRFAIEETDWKCDLSNDECEREERRKPTKGEVASPDGTWAVFTREHNLHVRSLDTGHEHRLTDDGEPWYDYGSRSQISHC
jgi:hypothetical protein